MKQSGGACSEHGMDEVMRNERLHSQGDLQDVGADMCFGVLLLHKIPRADGTAMNAL